jgi:hypothetical protein
MTTGEIIFYLFALREYLGGVLAANLWWLKLVSLGISAALLFGIVFISVKLNLFGAGVDKLSEIIGRKDLSRRKSIRAWQRIEQRLAIGDESQLKLAIIEADKILDEIIKMAGISGETMAERLKKISPAQLTNIEDVWEVHKVRNRIVHEPDFALTRAEAEYAIEVYRRALKELGLID